MQKKSLLTFLLAGAFALIGSIVGIAIGGLLYGTLLSQWIVTSIGQVTDDAVDILFVDYQYLGAVQLEGNTLYVQTPSGEVYSVLRNRWQLLSPLPNGSSISQIWLRDWEVDAPIVAITTQGAAYQKIGGQWELIENRVEQFKGVTPTVCAAKWHLPVAGAIDSAGTVFSHALADEYVCYVLFNDGRLQVWTRTLDAFSLMRTLVVGALVGLVAGFNAIPTLNYLKNIIRGVHHIVLTVAGPTRSSAFPSVSQTRRQDA